MNLKVFGVNDKFASFTFIAGICVFVVFGVFKCRLRVACGQVLPAPKAAR